MALPLSGVESMLADAGDPDVVESWEQPLRQIWKDLEEDAHGNLLVKKAQESQRLAERRTHDDRVVERGMIRYVFLCVDNSEAMKDTDLRPSRSVAVQQLLESFLADFFDQNPLSQAGLIETSRGEAHLLCGLTGHKGELLAALSKLDDEQMRGGVYSLENTLLLAHEALQQVPLYGTREVIALVGALATVDQGDILETADMLRDRNVKVSLVGLAAHVHVMSAVCKRTGGQYRVPSSQAHFNRLLSDFLQPEAVEVEKTASRHDYIRMGFPQLRVTENPVLCACHKKFQKRTYECPRCAGRYCELPIDCVVCSISLTSSAQLARSYHHLFPVANFVPVAAGELVGASLGEFHACLGCDKQLDGSRVAAVRCPKCLAFFCLDCDSFVHETLHNCPGCL